MSPIVHGMIAWLVAIIFAKQVNDRRLIVIAGVVLDIDGIFVLFNDSQFYEYHHTFGHSLVFGLLVAIVACALSTDKIKIFFGALSAFSMHLVADIVGTSWPVPIFYPLSDFSLTSSTMLTHNQVYNIINPAVFIICLILILIIMYYKEVSPIEFISEKLDNFIIKRIFPIKSKEQKTYPEQ
ncbi:MAG: metal-dependent hydrolase [Candidatus Thermoplasmatota archaeon]|nr:metal-dependent hydrolase [Euryarchaeota archaeon]MBU4031435.1 metal-dependent hydrolase [Candidatus Thermoplasmatota archaeon]MBU4144982.1 metal-dependent hydrolase [Candidatus Thermoplasmatota archaeon]MBU4591112.1 metal-dependent hydrolase [Candidatus Thermoplasmatota archaeon]